MEYSKQGLISRRHFCFCCVAATTYAATNGWLTPRQAYAEARGLVSLIRIAPPAVRLCGRSARAQLPTIRFLGASSVEAQVQSTGAFVQRLRGTPL
jgi:hypothetical protein